MDMNGPFFHHPIVEQRRGETKNTVHGQSTASYQIIAGRLAGSAAPRRSFPRPDVGKDHGIHQSYGRFSEWRADPESLDARPREELLSDSIISLRARSTW